MAAVWNVAWPISTEYAEDSRYNTLLQARTNCLIWRCMGSCARLPCKHPSTHPVIICLWSCVLWSWSHNVQKVKAGCGCPNSMRGVGGDLLTLAGMCAHMGAGDAGAGGGGRGDHARHPPHLPGAPAVRLCAGAAGALPRAQGLLAARPGGGGLLFLPQPSLFVKSPDHPPPASSRTEAPHRPFLAPMAAAVC